MDSCPMELEAFVTAHNIRIKEEDYLNWYLGQYFASAIGATVGNMFKKKSSPNSKYVDKPFLQQLEELRRAENMNDEDKKKAIDKLFTGLKIMETNFELNKKKEADAR